MDPQGWREIRALFDELTALLPIEQQERLEAIGAVHPEVCRSAETLLAADAAAPRRLRRLDSLFGVSPSSGEDSAASADETPTGDPLGLCGRRVSHFQVQEAFGAGGMGVVYRAEDTRLGRPVALKFLLPQLSLDTSAKARFLQEARAAATLNHANLCTIHEIGESAEGQLFLAMPLYPGETLRARLRRESPLPVSEALAVARQIAQGLSAVHGAGVVHRDLKPGNVMLLPDGGVKLLDFGLAKMRELSVTGSDLRLGTLPYMAPEQVRDAGDVDARADLWALGVVFYEMLTGRLPFGREHELPTIDRILREAPAPPSKLRQDLPTAAEHIVMTLLQKEPARRYASAETLLQDLARLPAMEESSYVTWQRVRDGQTASHARGWPWRRVMLAALVLAVLAGVGMFGGGTFAVWRHSGRGATPSAVPEVATETSSIAVLPFENVSGAREHEYLADGITQEIFTALATVRSLRVISPTSAMRYRNSAKSSREIAGELGVAHLLTGRVQREADRVRIWVQLIDARRDAPLWAERYERQLENIFAVQSDIAQQIAAALQAELTSGERARLTRGRTSNPRAYDYVLRAQEFLLRFNLRDNDAGIALVRQALELDPNYPNAHAVLAMAFAMRYWQVGDRSLLHSAVVAGRRAIALDSTLAGAYSSLGWALDHSGDPAAALQAHQRAVELSPNHSDGLAALHHWGFGRLDEAARWWAPALARDPTNTNTYWQAGKTYLCLGMLARARELLGKSVTFEPSFTWAQYHLTLAFLREGNREQARIQIERMLASNREDPSALTFAGLGAFDMEDLAAARGYLERGLEEAPAYERLHGTVGLAWILQQSGEEQRARELVKHASHQFEQFWGGQPKRPQDFMDLAKIRLLQGNREEALRLMETAVGRGWRFVYHDPNAPILGSLQGNPRYDALMAEVHADIERMRARVEREGW